MIDVQIGDKFLNTKNNIYEEVINITRNSTGEVIFCVTEHEVNDPFLHTKVKRTTGYNGSSIQMHVNSGDLIKVLPKLSPNDQYYPMPITLNECMHEYVEYVGILNQFWYCSKCDKKRE